MEILAHISAPATVHDDKQYLSLAQAIVDFKPAAVTRVTTCEDAVGVKESQHDSLSDEAANTTIMGSLGLGHQNPLKRPRTAPAANPNPPYRNPFRKNRHNPHTEPLIPHIRPRPALEPSPNTVHVPRTHTEIRRALSDPLQSITSKVTDSQINQSPETSSDARISSPLGLKGDIVISLSQTSIDDQPPSKRARLQDRSPGFSSVIATRRDCHSPCPRTQLFGWSSSPPPLAVPEPAPDSDTSTATPSQPVRDFDIGAVVLDQSTPIEAQSFITISSGPTQRQPEQPVEQEHMQTFHDERPRLAGNDLPKPFAAIDGLPAQTLAPQPAVGDGKFSSHVTGHLQELMDRPQLQKIFQPLRVTRDVKVLERGYWLMEITIATDEVVRLARSSPTKEATVQSYSDRFAGATAEERLARYWRAKAAGAMTNYDYGHEDDAVGKWTDAEFLTFWDQFSTFIQRGRAGWAVKDGARRYRCLSSSC